MSETSGVTMYLDEDLWADQGYRFPESTNRLIIDQCRINGRKLPKVDLWLPAETRAFSFEGPFLVLENDKGQPIEKIAPLYVRL
jgi:hypothetical protein